MKSGFEAIKYIEQSVNVKSLKFKDAEIWPLFRRLFEVEYNKEHLKAFDRNLLNKKGNIKVLISLALYGVTNVFKLFTSKFYLFSNSDRRKKVENCFEDRILEGLLFKLKSKYLLIENPIPQFKHYKIDQIPNKSLISDVFLNFISVPLGKIASYFYKIEKKDLLNEIGEKLNINVNYKIYWYRFLGQYLLMNFILTFNKPKVVFFVYPGSWLGFLYAFNKRGIRTVELQHGVINNLHTYYNYFYSHDSQLFPSQFWAYGDNDFKLLKNSNYISDQSSIKIIGNYYLDRIKQSNFNIKFRGTNEIKAVFSHQDIFEEKALEFILEIAEINSRIDFYILPRFMTDKLTKIETFYFPNIYVEKNQNIYHYLKDCDYHITVNSTTTYEADFFDTPSILIDIEGHASSYFNKSPVKAIVIEKPEDFSEAIIKINDNSKFSLENTDYFFKSDYSNNLKNQLLEVGVYR